MSPLLGFIRQLCIPHEQLAIMQWLVPSGKWQAKPPRVSAISYDASNCYEARYPYLDRRLCGFLFSIPREQILRSMQRRSLMRQALVGIVPSEILQRKQSISLCVASYEEAWPILQDRFRHSLSHLRYIDNRYINNDGFLQAHRDWRQLRTAPQRPQHSKPTAAQRA